MALDLLRLYPALALALDVNNQTPLLALASVSYAYQSGNRLIFWKQWIYDSEYNSFLLLSIPLFCYFTQTFDGFNLKLAWNLCNTHNFYLYKFYNLIYLAFKTSSNKKKSS